MRSLLGALGIVVLSTVSLPALAAPADELRQLLEQGRAAQAYQTGKQHPGELGKPDFDFYFGIAAVDSGHAGEGVLALERYVIQFPDNDRARLELGRAYFVLGELVRAREEFEAVLKRSPPAAVRLNVERFLDAIKSQESRYTTTATGYVEAGGGYDSNINSGVSGTLVNVPAGVISVVQSGVRTSAPFLHLGAGGQLSVPVAPGTAVFGGASLEAKLHRGELDKTFDQTSYSAYLGGSHIRDRDLYRLTASYSQLNVDWNDFRRIYAIGGEWHRQVDELNTGNVFLQYAKLEYPDQPVRDSDFYGAGVGWRRAFISPLRPVLQGQVMLGREENSASPPRDDLSRDLITLRGSVSLTPAPMWGISAALTYTGSNYKEPDLLLGAKREDDYFAAEAGLSYRWTKNMTLRADYVVSENQSNIGLFTFRRQVLTLRARYEF